MDNKFKQLINLGINGNKIITTSDVDLSDKNIFIFPQERAINYLNKVERFDIMIIDDD